MLSADSYAKLCTTVEEFLALANRLSGVSFATLLAVILWASWRGEFYWRRDMTALRDDRDQWRAIALRNLAIGEEAIRHAAKLQGDSPEKRSA